MIKLCQHTCTAILCLRGRLRLLYGSKELREPSSAYSSSSMALGLMHTATKEMMKGCWNWLRICTYTQNRVRKREREGKGEREREYLNYSIHCQTINDSSATSCRIKWLGVVLLMLATFWVKTFTATVWFLKVALYTSPKPPFPMTFFVLQLNQHVHTCMQVS